MFCFGGKKPTNSYRLYYHTLAWHVFHLSPLLCPSTAGCSPPSVSSIVFCLLLSWSRWFPPGGMCYIRFFFLFSLFLFCFEQRHCVLKNKNKNKKTTNKKQNKNKQKNPTSISFLKLCNHYGDVSYCTVVFHLNDLFWGRAVLLNVLFHRSDQGRRQESQWRGESGT